jgi:hypothetical protein
MLKGLPLNARATRFAVRCGFDPPPNFHGDYITFHLCFDNNYVLLRVLAPCFYNLRFSCNIRFLGSTGEYSNAMFFFWIR